MNNTIAIWMGTAVVGLIALDGLLFGAQNLLFLGQKLVELINWLAFWR